MKPHIIVLLVVLLIGGIILPASGYTLLEDYTVTSASGGAAFSSFYIEHIEAFAPNVTHVVMTGTGYTTIAGGTYSGVLSCGAGTSGNYTFTATYGTNYSNYTNPLEYDIDFINFNRGTKTGQVQCTFVNLGANVNLANTRYTAYPPAGWVANPNRLFLYPNSNIAALNYKVYGGAAVNIPVASFACVPTSQFPDTGIVCTDTSTNTPTNWLWSIDMEGAGIKGWETSTSRNFTWQSHYPGLYSVNLWANNSAGGDWENKTNYVSISVNATPNNCNLPVASGYYRTEFQCQDTIQDSAISGCNLQLRDLEGGAWSNITDSSDGLWCIDTLPAHHVSGYGQATGYTSGSRLNMDTWPSITTYSIPMIPGYLPPATTGKIWVYVIVDENGANLPGVTVSLSGTGQTTRSDVTDGTGSVHIQWPNLSEVYINAAKAGYTTSSRVFTTSASGPDTIRISLHKGTSTMPLTPTPGPGGTVPTTANPYGTPGPLGTMPAGYTNNQGQIMMDYLASHGLELVELCFLVTILAFLGVRLGGK